VEPCRPYIDVLIESIIHRGTHVREILIAVTDAKEEFDTCRHIGEVRVRRFGVPMKVINFFGHALGLQACIKRAAGEYILFSDPDVFWYMGVDKFFLNMVKEYNLNYIGVAHHNAINQCFFFFPYVIQSMARKDTLPDDDWLRDSLYYNRCLSRQDLDRSDVDDWKPAPGDWLIPGPVTTTMSHYPNQAPDAIFDVGCNMWMWNEERKGRWVSFLTRDCKDYTIAMNRANFKLPKLPMKKLIHHNCDSARAFPGSFEKFRELYEQSK
jgi:hypothetical protein